MSCPMEHRTASRHLRFPLFAIPVLLLIGVLYWPVHTAGFVWDDKICFHDNAWLWAGDKWPSLIFHGFTDWKSYFRPLGIALFVAEARVFDVAPGPIHLVSLALHLFNTVLVGALALRLCPKDTTPMQSKAFAGIAMLVYGVHPALTEPVSWIASQFDLLVTLFILLGLWMNLIIGSVSLRATLVGGCFFLAACTKEVALAFPVLLGLVDWLRASEYDPATPAASTFHKRVAVIVRRQWPVYVVVIVAGVAYLGLRHWALAGMVSPSALEPFLAWQRFQTVCFTYLIYWRMIIWPFVGLSPEHIIPAVRFAVTDSASILTDLIASVIGILGLILALKGRRLGILIVGVTATLLPVLHLIPIGFDESLYHERYAAPAIAFACMLLPGACAYGLARMRHLRFATIASTAALALWLLLAVVNVRITVPLWANDVSLWQWALKQNPDNPEVQNHLLSAYLDANDFAHAHDIADALMTTGTSCPSCMLNVAFVALAQSDAQRAAVALQKADKAFSNVVPTPSLIFSFVVTTGNLHQLNHDAEGAEGAYRDAISLDPQRPDGYMCLALLQARLGKSIEARATLDKALALSAADDIPAMRTQFDEVLVGKSSHSADGKQ